MTPEETFMQRSIQLARLGGGWVHPNPRVGAVLVANNTIIGEGWHKKFGGAHAEIEAIRSVKDQTLLRQSTLYVTLEPCAHQGKTPPCSEAIIKAGIPRVVIAVADPNPLVNGAGIKRLKQAGIEVTLGILAEEAREMNIRFLTLQTRKRPYVILKWAQGSNGIMGKRSVPVSISSPASKLLMHRWRSREHGILAGYQTVLTDNPKLDARLWGKPDPIRIIWDDQLTLPADRHVFQSAGTTWVVNQKKSGAENNMTYLKVKAGLPIQQLLDTLAAQNLVSLFVEGGSRVLHSFLESGLWDEARVFVSPDKVDGDVKAPVIHHQPVFEQRISGDRLLYFRNS